MDRTRYFRASGIDWLVKGLLALHVGAQSRCAAGVRARTPRICFVEADIAMKEKALARSEAPDARMRRFQAPDSHPRFLQAL